MNWLDIKTSLYLNHSDNVGEEISIREIIYSRHSKPHAGRRPFEEFIDIDTIRELRSLDYSNPDYKKRSVALKAKLQAWTPAAFLKSKASGLVEEIHRTGIMQLDLDYSACKDYDIEELKKAIFSLPFVALCSLSCSGLGMYILILIEEPAKLSEYASYCFDVFEIAYDIKVDTSKGKKPENLRYMSYDENILVRENVKPLKLSNEQLLKINPKKEPTLIQINLANDYDLIARKRMRQLRSCVPGTRNNTIMEVGRSLGSMRDESRLTPFLDEIKTNPIFEDDRENFLKTATSAYNWGWTNQREDDKKVQEMKK